jgi:hypothetical protein
MENSRREFLAQLRPQRPTDSERPVVEALEPSERHAVRIETDKALFRIVYGGHSKEQSADDIAHPDALVLEQPLNPGFDPENSDHVDSLVNELLKGSPQYKGLVAKAEHRGIPIFMPDLTTYYDPQTSLERKLRSETNPEKALLFLAGLLAISGEQIRQKLPNKKNISRRAWMAAVTTSLASVYLSREWLLIKGTRMIEPELPDEGTISRIIDRFLIDLNEKTHSESLRITSTFRNLIMGYKLQLIADQVRQGQQKPEIDFVVGAYHTGIERVLQEAHGDVYDEIAEMIEDEEVYPEISQEMSAIIKLQYDARKEAWKVEREDLRELVELHRKNKTQPSPSLNKPKHSWTEI